MPKLPSVKPRQIVRFLEKKGFVLDHTSVSSTTIRHPDGGLSFRSTIATCLRAH